MATQIKQTIVDDIDHILCERGNTYVSLRKVKWSETGNPQLDIRKYFTASDGSETIGKGVTLPDEAAHELVTRLASYGYGETREVLESIKDREDFMVSLTATLSSDDKELLQKTFPDMDFSEPEEPETSFYDIREELS